MSTETQSDQEMTEETAERVAKRWSEYDVDDVDLSMDVLEIKVLASLDGQAREFILVTGTGGPHVEVNLTKGRVDVTWWSSEASWPIVGNDDTLAAIEERLHYDWEAAETYV